MKPSAHSSSLILALMLGSLTLVGCGGALNFPDSVASTNAAGPPIQGSVYGGHAPIQGSHVYLLQPSVTAYGGAATSILGTGTTTSPGGYTLQTNPSTGGDPNVPAGAEYVVTDSGGGFNLTGAYTCTVGQPVYIYAYGGNIGQTSTTTPTTVTLNITAASVAHAGGTYTYTFTAANKGATPMVAGNTVTLTLANSGGGSDHWNRLNGAQTVATANSTTFTVTGTTNEDISGSATGTGTYTYNATTTNPAVNNSSIVQLATLGNCPGTSGEFANNISFVYLNEVSTVATAYTFQPFTLATNNSAWDIGTDGSTQALLGIANAANTAAQLYNIQGGTQISSSGDGEGHLANYQTLLNGVPNEGNGVVPQATIDSLANILAACVDSTPVGGGGPSAQCTSLFDTATDNGASTGTKPLDTGTAAINIARYPAGNHSAGSVDATYAKDLWALQTGTVPYVPDLVAAPNDWTIAINYPTTEVATAYFTAVNPQLGRAESIQVDSKGEIWVTAQTNFDIVRFSPLGAQDSVYSSADNLSGPTGYIYGYVSIDGNNNAWAGNANGTTGIQEFNSNGVLVTTYGSGYTTAYTVVADSNDNAYFFASNATTGDYDTYTNSEMWEYNSGGTLVSGSPKCDGHTAAFVYNCISQPTGDGTSIFNTGDYVAHGAIESAAAGGDLWVTSESSPYQIARVSPAGVAAFVIDAPAQQPEFPAIDANGNAWIAIQEEAAVVEKITNPNTGAHTALTSASTGAALTWTFGAAVDGNNNIWLANRCGGRGDCTNTANTNTIVEINGATDTAISPPTNYIPEAQYPATAAAFTKMLDDSLNVAIDPSGNVWVTNYIGNSVVELVGAAAPVVTPLSVAAGSNKLGVKP